MDRVAEWNSVRRYALTVLASPESEEAQGILRIDATALEVSNHTRATGMLKFVRRNG